MCDFSLKSLKSRPAKVADRLITTNFGTGTRGFADADDSKVAVCLLPGTELSFDREVAIEGLLWGQRKTYPRAAIFRQIRKDEPSVHHDMLEFSNGEQILLTVMPEGLWATVLQLPAAPKTEAEAQEQKRVEFVG